jgi:hypothetical protein
MLFKLLTMPIDGFLFVLKTVQKAAEEQWTDDAPLKERLLELQLMLDSGEISEKQYIEAEGEILHALRDIQNRKMEMAGMDPNAAAEGISGKLEEGSSVSFHPDVQFMDEDEG